MQFLSIQVISDCAHEFRIICKFKYFINNIVINVIYNYQEK